MKNVSKKLLNAIKQVGGKVNKTGYNSFSKYHYITESDVNEAILPALLAQGLLLTTSVESHVETPSGPDSKNRFAIVRLVHQIIDTDSGEILTLHSVGTAADTLDKSVYKALTGSCKYFMLKLFCISGDDSDPENDGPTKPSSNAPAAKPQAFVAKAPATPAPAPKQAQQQPQAQAAKPTPSMSFKAPAAASGASDSKPKLNMTTKPKSTNKPDFGVPKVDVSSLPEPSDEPVDIDPEF